MVRLRSLVHATVGIAIALVAAPAGAQSPGATVPGEPGFEYANDPQTLVVAFSEALGELAEADPGPTLRLYGDGRLAVHYPAYMQRAGEYSVSLSSKEMHDLVASLVGKRLVEFDTSSVRGRVRAAAAQRRAAAAARGELVLFSASDPSTIEIELNLDRYRPAGPGPELRHVARRISWRGLRADAGRYPEIAELQDLAAAHRELTALMERRDLAKVD